MKRLSGALVCIFTILLMTLAARFTVLADGAKTEVNLYIPEKYSVEISVSGNGAAAVEYIRDREICRDTVTGKTEIMADEYTDMVFSLYPGADDTIITVLCQGEKQTIADQRWVLRNIRENKNIAITFEEPSVDEGGGAETGDISGVGGWMTCLAAAGCIFLLCLGRKGRSGIFR